MKVSVEMNQNADVGGVAGLFVGMDEAGYGPNLGPLVIVATRWALPEVPQQCELYKLLQGIVSVSRDRLGQKLHIADSKVVHVGKHGFRALETSALTLLQSLGWKTDTFQGLWRQLIGGEAYDKQVQHLAPWYVDDLKLPVAAEASVIRGMMQKLQSCMEISGATLLDVRGDLIVEERFNQEVERFSNNKGQVLSQNAFRLLRSTWDPGETVPTLFVGDKHGGRNRYDELLAGVMDGEMILRLEEGQQMSRYRVGCTELRFQVGGESHLPVACASIIAKYLRELSMDLLNQYWEKLCPGVKPTRGYPMDARRFRDDVNDVRQKLGLCDQLFWRSR
ncbi:hypothetical protein SH668x_001648 [Planctomicrobium sp. SH668]|uniref:hypothetical protein n=1 Tax=Planctomicrobium sp. SH668 TaxID=3448126 RepID=UPI003F5BFD2D